MFLAGGLWVLAAAAENPSADPAIPESSAQVWRIDTDRSVADFEVRALGIIPVRGRFVALSGAMTQAPAAGTVEVLVPVGQLQMKSQTRRDWALSDEFFDAARHPRIRFSAALELDRMLKALADGKAFDIEGQLSLRGETHGQQFQVTHSSCEFTTKTACDIELSADISRKRFGMAAHSFALADNVSMKIQLQLVKLAP